MTTKAPPGFSTVPVNETYVSDFFPGYDSIDIRSITADFIKPDGFSQRNQQLIIDVLEVLENDSEKLGEFKKTSSEFRNGQTGPGTYYTNCAIILGSKNFQKLFIQLVTLLPDIRKQQELLIAHKHACKAQRKREDFSDILDTCVHCKQVILCTDADSHYQAHRVSDQEFPTLGMGASKKSSKQSAGKWARPK